MPPLITCVIPVRDGERFLAAAIDSVLEQDHRPLEVIVVDDGSIDASAEIAETYGEPVRVIRQQGGGAAAARNAGIRAARGEYVAFLDADDLFLPGKLTIQLEELDAHPEADLCLSTAENFWEEPELEVERRRYTELGKVHGTYVFMNLLARRSVFDRIGPLDENRSSSEDIEWFLRAGDLGIGLRILPEILVARRMHSASLTHSTNIFDPLLDLVAARIKAQRARAEPRSARSG